MAERRDVLKVSAIIAGGLMAGSFILGLIEETSERCTASIGACEIGVVYDSTFKPLVDGVTLKPGIKQLKPEWYKETDNTQTPSTVAAYGLGAASLLALGIATLRPTRGGMH